MVIDHIYAPGEVDGSDGLLGIIIRELQGTSPPGGLFHTPRDLTQQVGYIKHDKGHPIPRHIHKAADRFIRNNVEVILVRKGKMRVDFYTSRQQLVCSRTVGEEDVVILVAGGHGFEALEDLELFEVRQGPYLGEQDKERF